MQRTMLKSKIHRFETYTIAGERGSGEIDNYTPRVVHVGTRNEILNIDREVATLLTGAPTIAA